MLKGRAGKSNTVLKEFKGYKALFLLMYHLSKQQSGESEHNAFFKFKKTKMNISGHHNICKTVGLPFKPFFFLQQQKEGILDILILYHLSEHLLFLIRIC